MMLIAIGATILFLVVWACLVVLFVANSNWATHVVAWSVTACVTGLAAFLLLELWKSALASGVA